ncbi:hypothetical protein ANN_04558 [Periplaneta americana]|uniref:Chitin-binding type-2 domain-containing protein n=1 Tax=Periplaneta americana TaxID=6978 RepID=A0ABQ8TAQ0_PERAM|nr:hypothetical protein ANN_04558 [Periplaneta americana]
MAGLCEGGNEPPCSLKAICKSTAKSSRSAADMGGFSTAEAVDMGDSAVDTGGVCRRFRRQSNCKRKRCRQSRGPTARQRLRSVSRRGQRSCVDKIRDGWKIFEQAEGCDEKESQGFIATLGLVSLFLVGGECWAPGSVDSCPPGDPPTCPNNPVDDFDNLFNHPSDCHYFIHCDAGAQPICKECPANLHFSPTLHVCDWPERAGCEAGSVDPPTNAPPVDPTPPTDECTTPEPGTCEDCPPECKFECPVCTCEDARIAHPTECEWYYQCKNYVPELVQCPGGWHFNDKKKICDCPCYADCTVKTCEAECPQEPVTTPCTCPVVAPEDEPVCPDSEIESYLPHAEDCTYYYVCRKGLATCGQCPDGQHWNVVKNECDSATRAGCVLRMMQKNLFRQKKV